MKVIFVDVDGVLNTPATWGAWSRMGYAAALESALIARVRQLALDTGARCVLSSTWRLNTGSKGEQGGYPMSIASFKQRGWLEAREHFVGATPYLAGLQRGQEIRAWLKAHPEVTAFVVLDDSSDMLGVEAHHVAVDPHVGLTDADCVWAKKILEMGPHV
jgi:hypothetical protein